jgi:hypothetical protein
MSNWVGIGEWIVADLRLGDAENVADPVPPKDGPMGTSVEHLERWTDYPANRNYEL